MKERKWLITGYFNGHQHAKYPVSLLRILWIMTTTAKGKDLTIRRAGK